jgi:hypothetical protein
MSDTAEHESSRTYWTAIYRVRHDGIEIGQTEQLKDSAEVTAQLLDRRGCRNIEIGTFKSHKAAADAAVKAWQEGNAGKEAA